MLSCLQPAPSCRELLGQLTVSALIVLCSPANHCCWGCYESHCSFFGCHTAITKWLFADRQCADQLVLLCCGHCLVQACFRSTTNINTSVPLHGSQNALA